MDKARIGQGILIHVCSFSDNEAITHFTDLATMGVSSHVRYIQKKVLK